MIRSGVCAGFVVAVAGFVVGCSGGEGSETSTLGSAVTRVVPESVGAHCPAGGQALQIGLDANANGSLDDDEVKGTSYACNGSSSTPELVAIPVGDPRCPQGGTELRVTNAAPAVLCHGADGAKGDRGEAGDAGAKGDQGDAGTGTPELKLGFFAGSQLVGGALLTCTTVDNASATESICKGLKLNGLDVRLGPNEANTLCMPVTGKGYSSASGIGTVSSALAWTNGAWSLVSGNTSPMGNLNCKR